MSNITLFNPAAWKSVGDIVLPISILAVCSFLDRKYEIDIIDQQIDSNWKNTLRNALKKKPVCVGITCITGRQVEFALSASRIVKEESDARIVWGGIQASQAPEVTIAHPLIDIIVKGEGYTTFPELIDTLISGGSLADVAGIIYKDNGRPVNNPDRSFVSMNELPILPYHLIDVANYVRNDGKVRSLDIITSSGCPYSCTFCYNNAFHKSRWRSMGAKKVLENITSLIDKYNINNIRVLDDQFFVDKKRDEKIVEGIRNIVNNGYSDFSWEVMGSHVNSVIKWDVDFIKALEESHCKAITIGIESGSDRLQKLIRKGLTVERILKVNHMLKGTRIRPLYSFMSGFPSETDDDLKLLIDLMHRLKNENPNIDCGLIHPYVPYPGTELFAKAVAEGFKTPESLEGWAEYSWDKYTSLDIPWISKNRQRMLLDLYYCSALMNPDYTYVTSRIYPLVARAFQRLAKYRINNLDFRFPIEIRTLEFGKKLFVESH